MGQEHLITDPIIVRIQTHFGVKTRKLMMEKWGIPYSTMKTWVHRDNIPDRRLAELAEREGLNLEWLKFGTGKKMNIEDIA